jgi:hypothetical protein
MFRFPQRPMWLLALCWIGGAAMLGVAIVSCSVSVPSKWDGAIAIRACGNVAVVQRRDGTIWLLREWGRAYRVDDPDKLC